MNSSPQVLHTVLYWSCSLATSILVLVVLMLDPVRVERDDF